MKSEKSVKSGRRRKYYSPEFKNEVIRHAQKSDQPIKQVARDLGIGESILRKWLQDGETAVHPAESVAGGALSASEKEELAALRLENKELKMEKEILRKATVFFAKQQM